MSFSPWQYILPTDEMAGSKLGLKVKFFPNRSPFRSKVLLGPSKCHYPFFYPFTDLMGRPPRLRYQPRDGQDRIAYGCSNG
jgi:hypothetical protein